MRRSLLSQCCLLAISSCTLSFNAQAGYSATGGNYMQPLNDFSSAIAGDYPLFASDVGSLLETNQPLTFSTSGSMLFAAYATSQAAMNLRDATLATNGLMADGARVNNASLTLSGGKVTTQGVNSAAVNGARAAQLTLNGSATTPLTLTTTGAQSSGVLLADGTLSASNLAISSSGNEAKGVVLAYSLSDSSQRVMASLSDSTISVLGSGYQGALMLGNGELTGNNLTLVTADFNDGINLYNANGGHATATITDSAITTANGNGVWLLEGDITLNNSQIDTQNGIGINVNKNASATVSGSQIHTSGNGADGVWIADAQSRADVSDSSFTTEGNGAHAFNAQYGPAMISNSQLTTHGVSSYGLYSESRVDGDKVTVNSDGRGGLGVFAANGGAISLANSDITTTGDGATGLLAYPGSIINGDNLTVNTAGDSAYALATRSGTLNIANSDLSTHGTAAGLSLSSNSAGLASSVTLDNSRLSSERDRAIIASSANSSVQLSNGTTVNSGSGVALDVNAGSQIDLKADNQVVINGDLRATAADSVNVTLSQLSTLTGAAQNISTLTLDNSSWNLSANSSVGALQQNGQVNFVAHPGAFSTLTLDSLSGNGSFAMNTDIAALRGDLLDIHGTAAGDHQLSINDSGAEPANSEGVLPVVLTCGGNATFSLKNGVVDAGVYQYELQQRGADWVLAAKSANPDTPDIDLPPGEDNPGQPTQPSEPGTDTETPPIVDPVTPPGVNPVVRPVVKPVVNPQLSASARSALGISNALPQVAQSELSTLRTRLGDIRLGKQQGGAWIRMLGNRSHLSGIQNSSVKIDQQGMMLGVDAAKAVGEQQMLLGVFGGFSDSQLDLADRSSGKISSFFIGAYNTWLLEDGWYLDAVAKANNYSTRTRALMAGGNLAKGGFNTAGLALSAELGRHIDFDRGLFIEPSALLSTGWINGKPWQLDNGMQVKTGAMRSQQAALNLVVGRTLTLESGAQIQPWLKAAAINEFVDSNPVVLNGIRFSNNPSGLRGQYGAGVSAQLTPSLQMYGEVDYSKGNKVEAPLGGSLGVRWSW